MNDLGNHVTRTVYKLQIISPRNSSLVQITLATMSKIAFVVDCDGFVLDKKFRPREMALTYDSRDPIRYGFDLRRFQPRDNKELKTVRFCYRRIHKIPKDPYPKENVLDPESWGQIIWCHLENLKKSTGCRELVVAYKGNQFIRDLLAEYDIPAVDIEKMGCPKPKDCFEMEHFRPCIFHDEWTKHCPCYKAVTFYSWLKSEHGDKLL